MSEAPLPDLRDAAQESAKQAGLRYITDQRPGLTREGTGEKTLYRDPQGAEISDPDTLRRIRSLAIPPAWTSVWIAPAESAHLQATGRDARGRKQYRYHAGFRAIRDDHKFHRMLNFARALPKIRRRVDKDLAQRSTTKSKVLAGLLKLLETTLIRVGNDEYARTNHSYGLTTMHNRHAKVSGATVQFVFKGKSGVRHSIHVQDRRLAALVRRCQDLPGQELFAWVDTEGQIHDVGSGDVNDYLREITGADFTAKDFRTWAGTVLAALALREFEAFTDHREAKKNILTAIEAVAKMLGNTPSVCRKCYIHPAVLDTYIEGSTIDTMEQAADKILARELRHLRPEEAAVVTLLQQRLAHANQTPRKRTKARELSHSTAR